MSYTERAASRISPNSAEIERPNMAAIPPTPRTRPRLWISTFHPFEKTRAKIRAAAKFQGEEIIVPSTTCVPEKTTSTRKILNEKWAALLYRDSQKTAPIKIIKTIVSANVNLIALSGTAPAILKE